MEETSPAEAGTRQISSESMQETQLTVSMANSVPARGKWPFPPRAHNKLSKLLRLSPNRISSEFENNETTKTQLEGRSAKKRRSIDVERGSIHKIRENASVSTPPTSRPVHFFNDSYRKPLPEGTRIVTQEKAISEVGPQKINTNLQDDLDSHPQKPFSGTLRTEFHDSQPTQDRTQERSHDPHLLELQKARKEVEGFREKNSKLSNDLESRQFDYETLNVHLAQLANDHESSRKNVEKLNEKQVEDLKTTISKLEKQNDNLKGQIEDLSTNLTRVRSERDDLERVQQDLELPAISPSIEKLSNLLAQAETERDAALFERNRVTQQLASRAEVMDIFKFDDSYFQRQFTNLRGNIKDWALKNFSAKPGKNPRISESLNRTLWSVSKYYRTYLESNDHRRFFVQGYVWHHLARHVFEERFWESTAMASGHTYGHDLQEYHRPSHSKESDIYYQIIWHQWRYARARYVVPRWEETQTIEAVGTARIERVAESIWKFLEMWSASTIDATQALDKLRKIVCDTVLLDLQIQQQKSFFSIATTSDFQKTTSGLQYKPNNMDVIHGKVSGSTRPQNVCLLITPLFVKWGKSDGTDYGTSLVIEKAQVDIEVPSSGSGWNSW